LNAKKKTILGVGGIICVIFIAACVGFAVKAYGETNFPPREDQTLEPIAVEIPIWESEGYDSQDSWNVALTNSKRMQADGCNILLNDYKDYLSAEEITQVEQLKKNIESASNFKELTPYEPLLAAYRADVEKDKAEAEAALAETEVEEAVEEHVDYDYSYSPSGYNNYEYSSYNYTSYDYTPATASYASYADGDGLTQSSGVNYYDGRRETYYSSNALYHYRTSEWTVDSEGFYRTDEGYYVVAASDMNQGDTFEGSKGTCIVLDSGCAAGTTDYYTSW
jgi:hypothetical protein